jgi:hypothetical protein
MFHYTEDDEVHGSSSDEEPLFEHNLTDDDEFCENVMDGDIARPFRVIRVPIEVRDMGPKKKRAWFQSAPGLKLRMTVPKLHHKMQSHRRRK